MFTSDIHCIQHSFDILAALRIRAFTYAISINRLALCWSDKFFILTIGNAVTISIAAYAMSVNRATFGSVWLKVKLVGNTITISIIQNRFWKLHVTGSIDFAISIIQWVKPPQRLNGFATDIIV